MKLSPFFDFSLEVWGLDETPQSLPPSVWLGTDRIRGNGSGSAEVQGTDLGDPEGAAGGV